MSPELSMTGLALALLLPWFCGVVWINALLGFTQYRNLYIVLAQGYFAGYLITTLLIRLWDFAGLELSFYPMAALLATVTAAGLVVTRLLANRRVTAIRGQQAPLSRWQAVIVALLMALLAWRYGTLLQELLLRPLYAWDAWMNWAPKAIVWFHQGQLVDFVHPDTWTRNPDAGLYTLGNRKASEYPETVPLIMLWSMLGAGHWEGGPLYLPWLMAPLCLGTALYGHLKLSGAHTLPSVLACYLLLSLPYIGVHAALAGYADLWVAAVFSLSVLALHQFGRNRHWAYGLLTLLMALMCGLSKNPGMVLGLIIALVVAREVLNLRPLAEMTLAGIAAGLLLVLFAVGVSVEVPGLGRLALSTAGIEVPGLGDFPLAFRNVSAAWLETLLLSWNWNLLWYLLAAWALYLLSRETTPARMTAEALAVLGAVCFLLFVFFFTRYYQAALSFITLNRSIIYVVPALIFIAFRGCQAGTHAPFGLLYSRGQSSERRSSRGA